jgi:hypothetical protein
MQLNINDPKVRWAQQVADSTGHDQAIMTNILGGLDIKPMSSVHLQSPNLVTVVAPREEKPSSPVKWKWWQV